MFFDYVKIHSPPTNSEVII